MVKRFESLSGGRMMGDKRRFRYNWKTGKWDEVLYKLYIRGADPEWVKRNMRINKFYRDMLRKMLSDN